MYSTRLETRGNDRLFTHGTAQARVVRLVLPIDERVPDRKVHDGQRSVRRKRTGVHGIEQLVGAEELEGIDLAIERCRYLLWPQLQIEAVVDRRLVLLVEADDAALA